MWHHSPRAAVAADPAGPELSTFADARALLGIPNVWNVVSNLPFIAVGAVGSHDVAMNAATTAIFCWDLPDRFGSSYYHWSPSDALVLDRLPMALAFMAILPGAVRERVNAKWGPCCCGHCRDRSAQPLLWRWNDDLRLYGWVQFFPCLHCR